MSFEIKDREFDDLKFIHLLVDCVCLKKLLL